MSQSHPRASACRNCGSASPGNFCPQCGQETSLHPPSLWEFAHEFLTHYVALEGPLWRTLRLLVLRPGDLTREFLAGRRRRFIPPLRLYLSASFLFFALSQVLGPMNLEVPQGPEREKKLAEVRESLKDSQIDINLGETAGVGKSPAITIKGRRGITECLQPGSGCNGIERLIARPVVHMQNDPQFREHFGERMRHAAPYAMFLLLPVFALLANIAYRKRKMYYGEHFVFALHLHAFWFLLSLVSLPLPDAVTDFTSLWMAGYAVWALRRVYGGRWGPTLLRSGFLAVSYLLAISLGAGALVVGLFLLS